MIRRIAALAAGAILAASAGVAVSQGTARALPSATWTDTSLQASTPFSANEITLSSPAVGTSTISVFVSCNVDGATLAVSAPPGWTHSALTACGQTLTLTIPAGGGNIPQDSYAFAVTGSPNPGHNATEKAVAVLDVTDASEPALDSADTLATFSTQLTTPPNTVYPDIQFGSKMTLYCVNWPVFSATLAANTDPCGYAGTTPGDAANTSDLFASSPNIVAVNPSSGLVSSGNQLLASGSTLAPGTYLYATVQNAPNSSDGTVASETFTLQVTASKVHVPGNLGDEVNGFGNGFDVFQQHWAGNALIVGWTATKGDPATHFVRIPHGGNWQFEAVNGSGIATGLCVSDPGGGVASDPLPDGLILRGCNNGPFQQFALVSAEPSQLKNAATHLVVYPDGTGAQLRGTTVPTGGDPFYTWKSLAQLPG
jgi:hypothetical protein